MLELVAGDFVLEPPLPLGPAQIHLWFFPQWPATREAAQSLPLRALLASYLACDPQQLRIERDHQGKPYLAGLSGQDAATGLQFNLSHSGGALLVGISLGQALGVDLEIPRRARRVLDLARRYFDPAEAAVLAALPEARREWAFLRLWSCKEAVLKALGQGLAFGLDRVVFTLDATGAVTGLNKLDGDPSPSAWHVVQLLPAANYSGALAWRGPAHGICAGRGSPPAP
jgi:4'-phosphopantetheinyl transferase